MSAEKPVAVRHVLVGPITRTVYADGEKVGEATQQPHGPWEFASCAGLWMEPNKLWPTLAALCDDVRLAVEASR